MQGVLNKRRFSMRRMIFLSPLITGLIVVGTALLIAMMVLDAIIIQQIQTNREVFTYNYTGTNRPFSQLEHEIMQMLVYVTSKPDPLDTRQFQEDVNVMASRWQVIMWPTSQAAFSEEIQANIAEMTPLWQSVQDLAAAWIEHPQHELTRAELASVLDEFGLITFRTDVLYQTSRNQVVSSINNYNQQFVNALAVVSVLLIGFLITSGYSVARFLRSQRQAEQKARTAIAAETAARETNQFKDQFLAVMSHELRTPLNAIIGFLGILDMTKALDEKSTHMVQRARANADRLLTLINDILDLSKIEAGRMDLVSTPVAIRDLAKRWEYQIEVLARQKNLKLTFTVDSSVPDRVMADESALTKIATNLLSNAVKFTETGEVSLGLKVQDRQLIFDVRDTGIGIPAHMFEQIFESFRQADSSTRRTYGGTGLGLSIVQHLVKAMDGTIKVQSVVGEGSTFTVKLPLVTPTEVQTPVLQVSTAAQTI